MPLSPKYNVVSYYDSNNNGMSVGCTPTSGILRFQWSLELLEDKSMDIHGNYGTSGSGMYDWFCYDSSNHRFHLQQYSPWAYCYSSVTNVTTGTVYNIEGIIASTGMSITVNGTTDTASGSAAGSRDFWLFNNGSGSSKANVRTYSLKIWDDDTLIGDLIPVSRKSDSLNGLWNRINDEVYYPGGHESFYDDTPWIQEAGEIPTNEIFPDAPEEFMTDPPDAIFRIDEVDDLPRNNLFEILTDSPVEYPADAMFRIDSRYMGGVPFEGLFLDADDLGAFANASSLKTIRIPPSVKSIGENAFTHSKLTHVRIAEDCDYSTTSFPKNCEVEHY